jgi:hypothetical protein
MSLVSDVTPDAFDRRTPRERDRPIEPAMSFAGILALGRDEGLRRGWGATAGSIFYSPSFGIYGVSFFESGDDDGAAGVGPPMLFYDGQDGSLLGDRLPWKGTMADVFVLGFFTSTQYTAMNTLVYADVTAAETSAASTIASTGQQMSISFGVAGASLIAAFFVPDSLRSEPAALIHGVHLAFIVLGIMTMASSLIFMPLKKDDGGAISRHKS